MKKFIFPVVIAGLFAGCVQDKVFELKGIVKVKGTEPHTYVVIKDKKSNNEFRVINHNKFNLYSKQNRVVTLKAKVIKEPIGPGFPAVVEIVQ